MRVHDYFKYLKYGKKLRGTKFDPLGYSYERKLERKIRDHYISSINECLYGISRDNYNERVKLAKQPENVRGFGHIKLESIKKSSLFKDLL